MSKEIVKKLINFIKDSPTCFHAVKNMKQQVLRMLNIWLMPLKPFINITLRQKIILHLNLQNKFHFYFDF